MCPVSAPPRRQGGFSWLCGGGAAPSRRVRSAEAVLAFGAGRGLLHTRRGGRQPGDLMCGCGVEVQSGQSVPVLLKQMEMIVPRI